MANVVYAVNVRSTYPARTVAAFPDVCKTPSPTAPVPIPYPNAAGASSTNANAVKSKQMRAHQLRTRLQDLHMQIASLPSGNANRWHKLLDDYVMLSAELYRTVTD